MVAWDPHLDPDQTVIRAGEGEDPGQFEEGLTRRRSEHGPIDHPQLSGGKHVVGSQIARRLAEVSVGGRVGDVALVDATSELRL